MHYENVYFIYILYIHAQGENKHWPRVEKGRASAGHVQPPAFCKRNGRCRDPAKVINWPTDRATIMQRAPMETLGVQSMKLNFIHLAGTLVCSKLVFRVSADGQTFFYLRSSYGDDGGQFHSVLCRK